MRNTLRLGQGAVLIVTVGLRLGLGQGAVLIGV